jgi:hypothetical protein
MRIPRARPRRNSQRRVHMFKEQTVVVSNRTSVKFLRSGSRWAFAILAAIWLLAAGTARAQNWTWTTEDVDKKSADATAIAVDAEGNVHLSYGSAGTEWKYAFRPAGTTRWDKTALAGGAVNYVSLVLDSAGNPHICSTFHRLRYAAFDGTKWSVEEVAPDAAEIGYSCTVGVGPDGKPHLAWYKEKDADHEFYVHLKYASLENGVWVARTVDFDKQTGKYHSMVVDAQGVPHLTYDAFVDGTLKYATRDKDTWNVRVVASRKLNDPEYNLGMGDNLFLDAAGRAHISYYTNESMHYAAEKPDGTFGLQTVDSIRSNGGWTSYRSAVVLDKAGNPHIIYQDGGTVKHAFFDGKQWHIQLVVHSGPDNSRYVSAAIDKNSDVLYVAYRDPDDESLKVAVGTPHAEAPQTAAAAKDQKP